SSASRPARLNKALGPCPDELRVSCRAEIGCAVTPITRGSPDEFPTPTVRTAADRTGDSARVVRHGRAATQPLGCTLSCRYPSRGAIHHGILHNVSALAIEVDGLTKSFGGGTHALRGVDFSVPVGTVCGLLGHNGAGKTTTINILSTLIRPDSG